MRLLGQTVDDWKFYRKFLPMQDIGGSDGIGNNLGLAANFPHPLTGISLSGTCSITADSRVAGGTSGSYFSGSWDLGDLANLARYTVPFPLFESGAKTIPSGGSEDFYLEHEVGRFWELFNGPNPSTTGKVGELTRERYSRADPADPWTLDDTETVDIDATFDVAFLAMRGGDPATGGRGANTDANSIRMTVSLNVTFGAFTGSPSAPGDLDSSHVIYRLPWDASWAEGGGSNLDTAFDAWFNSNFTSGTYPTRTSSKSHAVNFAT